MRQKSTKRVKSLRERRKEAGWRELNGWLEPEVAQLLDQRCQVLKKKPHQIIADLLVSAGPAE